MEKTEPGRIDADKLFRCKTWRKNSVIIIYLGVTLILLPLTVGIFFYGFFAGALSGLLTPGFGWVLIIIMGIGVVLFLSGVISYFIALSTYSAQKLRIIKTSRDSVVESLVQRVQNKDFGRDRDVITILGDLGDRNATLALIETLKDSDAGVREKSARALGNIKDERAGAVLWAALKDDKVDKVKSQAAVALDKLNWKPCTNAEKAYFFIWKRQWTKVEQLGEAAIEPLLESLRVGDKGRRIVAAQTLGKLGDKRALSPLIEALKDEDKDVRSSAKSALKKIKRKT